LNHIFASVVCGTVITMTSSKRNQGRFVQGHVFRTASGLVPEGYPELSEAAKGIPAWKAMMNNVQEISAEVFNGKRVLQYGLMDDLESFIK